MSQHAGRRDKLRRQLRKHGASAMLVTHPVNVTYLTGFAGEASYLLLASDQTVLLSDSRFTAQIAEECGDIDVEIRRTPLTMMALLQKVLRRFKADSVAIESDHVTMALFAELQSQMPRVEWVATSGLVERLRMIKDRGEIEAIRRAVRLAEKAIGAVIGTMQPTQTEWDTVREIEYQIRRFGGVGCSFPPIVGVGPRAALPHAPPTRRTMDESDFVLIDWGARESFYVSDLTRVFVTAKISPKLERIYGLVSKAQRQAILAIKPGVTVEAVDAVARKTIAAAGYGKQFSHGLGHGIGLEVHEAPRLAANQPLKLKAGMVVTVEPGVYLPGWGGVRIEDDVLVTRDGHEVLSTVTKELDECVLGW
jgi:Xaa-Pro aminopeptidase